MVAALIVAWLVRRVRSHDRRSASRPERTTLGGSAVAFALAVVASTGTAVVDPTFLATVAIVNQGADPATVVAAFAIWTLLSQFVLFGLAVAHAFGAHDRTVAWVRSLWRRHRRIAEATLVVIAAAVAALRTVDAVHFLVMGDDLST